MNKRLQHFHGWAVCLAVLHFSPAAHATEAAHVHGSMQLDIAVDKQLLSVQLEAPLDSLLGFERHPRSAAERQAADALLKQMTDAAALFKPDAAAQGQSKQTLKRPDKLVRLPR